MKASKVALQNIKYAKFTAQYGRSTGYAAACADLQAAREHLNKCIAREEASLLLIGSYKRTVSSALRAAHMRRDIAEYRQALAWVDGQTEALA
jgi:hypothetical protein